MRVNVEWSRPIPLRDATRENLIYKVDLSRLPTTAGVYIMGRRWGSDFEALYIGKASNIRSRVRSQLNNLRVMQHLRNAKTGRRVMFAGRLVTKRGQRREKTLGLAERVLIRHFLSEGGDLVNKQGTRIRRHEVASSGRHPKRYWPRLMYLEKARRE